jgi:hypothetical protein
MGTTRSSWSFGGFDDAGLVAPRAANVKHALVPVKTVYLQSRGLPIAEARKRLDRRKRQVPGMLDRARGK